MADIADIVIEATKNLRREGIKTFLTLIGVVIGITAIVSLLSIGAGLNASIAGELSAMGSNTIFVEPGSISSMMSGTSSVKMTESDISFMESLSTVKSVLQEYQYAGTIEFGGQKKVGMLVACDDKSIDVYVDLGYLEVAEGRWLEPSESTSVVINDYIAEEMFDKEIGLRKQILINGKEYKVVGIGRMTISIPGITSGTGMMFTTEKGIRRIVDNPTPVEIMVTTTSKDVVRSTADEIKEYFDDKYGKKSVMVMTYDEMLDMVNSILSIITIFLSGIAGISLVVGGVGIMNAMITSVIERTREIGVMKAMGASDGKVLAIFLLEAGFIGVVGGIVGVLFGYAIAGTIAVISTQLGFSMDAIMTVDITLGALAFSMFVGMVAGFYPALRAARMDPVEALRYE